MENITKTATTHTQPASAWSRAWATITDGLILGIPSLLLYFLLITPLSSLILSNKISEANNLIKIYGIFILVASLFYYVYLTVKKGATWGKDLYGLRVVKYKTTQHINYKTAIIREVTKIALGYIPIINFLTFLINMFIIIFTKEKRAIHDRIAGTQVIKATKPWPMKKQVLIFLPILLFISILLVYLISQIYVLNKPLQDDFSKPYTPEKLSVMRNAKRKMDINEILNAINQYMANNNGTIPSVITTSEREISKSGADLCSYLAPNSLSKEPTAEGSPALSILDCDTPYSTGYTIFKDASTNKITVRAPNAELGEKIEVTR